MLKSSLSFLLSFLSTFFLLISLDVVALDVSIQEGAVPQALLQLNVLDVKETWLNNKKALSIIFSHKLAKDQNYSNFITATVNGVSLKGRWIQTKKNANSLYLSDIKMDKKYEIFIRPGILSKNGLKLLKPKHFNIMTQPVPASINFLDQEKSFSIEKLPKLDLQTTGIMRFNARIYRLNPDKKGAFIEKLQQIPQLSSWKVSDISAFSNFLQNEQVIIQAPPDKRVINKIKLQQTTQLSTGLYFVSVKARTTDGLQLSQLFYFSVSDIAVRIDNLPNSTDIVTFSKTQAKLLDNIEFSLISPSRLTEQKTDKDGRSHFLLSEEPYVNWLLILSSKNDTTQFSLKKIPQRKKIYHDIVSDTAHIFLNKRNYKIGEQVGFSILLRDKNNQAIADQVLYIKLFDAEQNLILNQNIVTPELGNVSSFFPLPLPNKPKPPQNLQDEPSQESINKGQDKLPWSIHVYRHEQDEEPLSTAEFYVAATDYLAAQLNIMTLSTLLTIDNNVPFLLKGYVDENITPENLKVVVQREINWQAFASRKYKQFHFGTASDKTLQGTEILQTLRLDAQGEAEFSLPKINNVLHSVLSVTLQAEMAIDQQAIARESETINYWPAKQMIGIYQHSASENKASKADAKTATQTTVENSAITFEFIYIDQAEQLLAANKVPVKIFKLSTQSNWYYAAKTGWEKTRNKKDPKEQLIETHQLSWFKNEKGKLTVNLPQGRYRLEVLSPETELRTDYDFNLPQDNHDYPPNQLQLSLDKRCYQQNDLAILNIHSPRVADAIVRIASDQVHWSKRLFLHKGENLVEIPIIKQLSHKRQTISVLGINKNTIPNMSLEGSLPLLLKSLKTPVHIEASQDNDWQALRLHADMYKNTSATVVLSRTKGDEILLPEIMPLIQAVTFDEEGNALLNNSEGKIDPKQKYYATLYFVDKTIETIDVVFDTIPLFN
jgi:uncharacterized protein YfaS (alpha-2-macroglobulin family)